MSKDRIRAGIRSALNADYNRDIPSLFPKAGKIKEQANSTIYIALQDVPLENIGQIKLYNFDTSTDRIENILELIIGYLNIPGVTAWTLIEGSSKSISESEIKDLFQSGPDYIQILIVHPDYGNIVLHGTQSHQAPSYQERHKVSRLILENGESTVTHLNATESFDDVE